jgi:hypothetical protein
MIVGRSTPMRPLSSGFILQKSAPTIADLQWALHQGVIGAQVVVDVASALAAAGDTSEPTLALAMLTHADLPEVRLLMNSDLDEELRVNAKAKWLWIILSWLFETERDEGLFRELDDLYADYGYPDEMRPFGPYSPAYEGRRDPTEVRTAILGELQRYLQDGERRFGRDAASK